MNTLSSLLKFIANRCIFKDEDANASIGGHFSIEGNSDYIGWRNLNYGTKSYTTQAAASPTKIADATTLDKGKYVFVAQVEFPPNTNGVRYIDIRVNGSASDASPVQTSPSQVANFSTRLQSVVTLNVSNDNTAISIYGYMYTGTASQSYTLTYHWQVIRIA